MSDPIPAMEELARRYLEHRRQFGYRLSARAMACWHLLDSPIKPRPDNQ